MKTTIPKASEIKRAWLLVNADGKTLGRLAVRVANLLRGRGKPIYTPAVDTGDFVVIINADKVKLSGTKEQNKVYAHYTGFRSGLKTTTAARLRSRHPERILQQAVHGMLPNNHLSRDVFKRLKVYAGTEHPHKAQNPQPVE